MWFMNGINYQRAAVFNPAHPSGAGWHVSGTLDLDEDGKTDLLFQHDDGTLAVWFMDGTNLTAGRLLNPSNAGSGWKIVAPK